MSNATPKPRSVRPARNPQEEAARLLRSPPVGSAVGDEPPAGIEYVDGGRADGEVPIVGQRLVRQVGPLFDLIRHKDTQMPLTAAIYGPWGSGKSTAMKWLDRMLECWSTGKSGEKSGGQKLVDAGRMDEDDFVQVRTVWFDPWKYQDRDDVLRGIIAEIIRETIKVQHSDVATVTNAVRLFGGMLGKTFLAGLESVKVKAGVDGTGVELQPDKAVRGAVEAYKEANHPELAFVNNLEQALSDWVKHTIPQHKRLVVFIDDLDRCRPHVAVQVLEALKLYLRIPRTIFVVGVDQPVITAQVKSLYDKHGVREVDAHRYLAKMFQVEVTLDAEEEIAEAFFESVASEHHVWESLAHWEPAQRSIRQFILQHADRNPREIKRLFNGIMMAAVGELWHEDRLGLENDEPVDRTLCALRGARRFMVRRRLELLASGRADLPTSSSKEGGSISQHAKEDFERCLDALGTRTLDAFFSHWRVVLLDREPYPEDTIRTPKVFKPFLCMLDDPHLRSVFTIEAHAHYRNGAFRDKLIDSVARDADDEPGLLAKSPIPRMVELSELMDWQFQILEASTHDLRIYREAASLALDKPVDKLTERDFEACEKLSLTGAELSTSEPLLAFPRLRRLDLDSSTLGEIEGVRTLSNLRRLFLGGTSIADLSPLSNLESLEQLVLGSAYVGDLTYLAALPQLVDLDVSEAGVRDITPILVLKNLVRLDLSHTGVTKVEGLAGLPKLKRLDLTGTNVSDESFESLRAAMPDCQIRR
ncbi:MAG: P-loop NTPase fold protein [Phycisphaerales bacterium]